MGIAQYWGLVTWTQNYYYHGMQFYSPQCQNQQILILGSPKLVCKPFQKKEETYKMTVAHQKYGFSKNMLLGN